MIGSCSKCVAPVLQLADDTLKAYPSLRVVAVSSSPVSEIEEFREANHMQLEMISDPDERLAVRYNAVWRPRAYLLSASGRLLWRQQGAVPDWQQAVDLAAGKGTQ